MGRGHRRRGPHGQPGESDAGERELGEEMARRGEQGARLEPGQGEGPGHPRGSSRGAPQPGRWVEAEGGASPHRGWRVGCLRLLGGWGDTGRGAQTPELIPLSSEGRRPDIQSRKTDPCVWGPCTWMTPGWVLHLCHLKGAHPPLGGTTERSDGGGHRGSAVPSLAGASAQAGLILKPVPTAAALPPGARVEVWHAASAAERPSSSK
ncbi:unnamed protein product [Rangifer tarandus platyrhynchus]|uniref:Uncharacterized protein n=1 Tax=Rangifer tarandus platyrhynchus TaxID=3082113 RepID=A0ABN8ZYS4_RANTA|nr:unnamed protein product [Rangifer tarandus platyrhynchus]